MCKQPAMRAPFKGFAEANSSRIAIKPGISASANFISFLPHSARLMSFTLYAIFSNVLIIYVILLVTKLQN